MDTLYRWLGHWPGVALLTGLLWGAPAPALADDPPAPPTAPPGQSGLALLPALIEATAQPAYLQGGRLQGTGADFLRAQLRGTRFTLLGEDHGSAGVARVAAAIWLDLAGEGYSHVAIETDPWMARYAESQLRRGGPDALRDALRAGPGAIALPFYGWDAEAVFLDAVLRSAPARRSSTLWGLDQVFLGSAKLLLADIERGARSAHARKLATELRPLAARSDFLPTHAGTSLAALEAALRHDRPEMRDRATAMRQSGQIYRAFTTGDREAWPANLEREMLMKQTLLRAIDSARREDRNEPRVLFKFGANHLTRGLSPTLVPSLGSFAMAWADARSERSVNVAVLCGPHGRSATFAGGDEPCAAGFNDYFGPAAKLLARGPISVIDLRVWRQRPARWAELPDVGRRIIEGYDLLIVVDGEPASRYLEGLDPPRL